jgi:hypothetical protein
MALRATLLTAVVTAFAAQAVQAGLVFREVEVTEPAGAVATRQVRRVFAQDGNLKLLIEESGDSLTPVGSYLLAGADDAVIVDPARSTVAPVVPADMQPVAAPPGRPAPRHFSAISLERQSDERGPVLLGLPTWHYVYLLRYQEDAPGGGVAARYDERHEFWAAALPAEESSLAAWRELRLAEDGGAGTARREIRDALAPMYEQGLFLKHIIERRDASFTGTVEVVEKERIVREVMEVSREEIDNAVFEKPAGFSQTEFLAPGPDEATGPAPPPRDPE